MDIWHFILDEINKSNTVVLITVVERNGSSPGIVGFKMAVSENGSMNGSIGGGVMEYNMVELAKRTAQSHSTENFIKKQIHNPDAGKDKSGLMCSGEQTHAFTVINSNQIDLIQDIVKNLDKGESGKLTIDNSGIQFNKTEPEESITYNYIEESNWSYTEQIGVKPTLYIFGAGHVSIPVSQIFRAIDFNVVILDNRKDLSTFNSNTFANRKEVINYKESANYVPKGENSYVVIMTVGHKSDEQVLEQFLKKDLKYLGMIGSKNKVKTIYESLKRKGFTDDDLAKVDSPIGLKINSKTTPEIGISIAAKVIQIKNS